ncbi:hypothetical protein SAMN06265348_110261 [Pedobacter westerhofensis]|uniref:Uncharacterized protein n=1 Tax=Pedobacter westerhofensis TaxID=425512 RepID=A0A521F798_9SPHI|nr:hypothetical protein [Pedobacter westerhofensis]SMO92088.1 hypothetical protein SAMN06265348_110261 [Pedobacter westerhofensis]
MNELEIEYQKINKGQWLSQTERFLDGTPSNYIIFKTLTNIGATHGEIKVYNWLNSIIVEPNVPVIVGKESELDIDGNLVYPDMLGVYNVVSKAAVIRYLKNNTTPKKIVCTPEAFESKVKPAILEVEGFDLYKDFFLLLDESDKLTTETDYRAKIILPMEDFFKFDHKAMISATALTPSDPRFAENGFKILKVLPQYEHKKTINLVGTNNVISALNNVLESYPSNRFFIFVNSADLIYAITKSLDIMDQSKAFCADQSVRKLQKMGMNNVSNRLGDFMRFNFITSRFFSAVDINVTDKPVVIVVTNVYLAPHSIVDPYTDVVQIAGRLRNGITGLVHITNFNPNIKYEERDVALKDIYDGYEEYCQMVNRLGQVTTDGGKVALIQATQRVDVKKFVNDQHEVLPYMVDNHIYEQQVLSYYRDFAQLKAAYDAVKTLNFTFKFIQFSASDAQLYNLSRALGRSNVIRCVAEILHSYDVEPEPGVITFRWGDTKADVERDHPDIVKDYNAIGGYDVMLKLNFDQAKITREIKKIKKERELDNPAMVKEIKSWYKPNDEPTATGFKARLRTIYKEYGVTKPASGTHILRYYNAEISTNSANVKVWKIQGLK